MLPDRDEGRGEPRPKRLKLPSTVVLVVVSVLLILGSAADIAGVAIMQQRADAYVGRSFVRIGAADSLTLASQEGSLSLARVRHARLAQLSAPDPEQARRVAAMAANLEAGPAGLRALELQVVQFRKIERDRIVAYRAGVARRQQIALAAAMVAVVLSFL